MTRRRFLKYNEGILGGFFFFFIKAIDDSTTILISRINVMSWFRYLRFFLSLTIYTHIRTQTERQIQAFQDACSFSIDTQTIHTPFVRASKKNERKKKCSNLKYSTLFSWKKKKRRKKPIYENDFSKWTRLN